MKKKFTVQSFQQCKDEGRKFTMVVVFDYSMARIVDESDVEAILVGDSVAMTGQGKSGTTPVTMDEMIYHVKCVVAGAPNTFVVGDMPFGSYNVSCEQAIMNANRLMKEGGCDCVKLEGGVEVADKIAAIVKAGIPVMGHIGLTPQTAAALGGFKMQGKSLDGVRKLIEDAKAVEAAGAFMTGLEAVPVDVAKRIGEIIRIPINGIGAGPYTDGPGMLTHDLWGIYGGGRAKFVKQYANLRPIMIEALNSFHREAQDGTYPAPENCYNNKIEGLEDLR